MKRPDITIVGCGPGAPEYITPLALKVIKGAKILVGARRLLDLFPDHQAETVIEMEDKVETVLEEMGHCQDHPMVVLVSGDPGLSSLARPVIGRFGREACQVIPGISSIQVAFARLGLDWGKARIIDAHSQDPKTDLQEILGSGVEKIAVLGGRQGSLEWLAKALQGLNSDWAVYVLENLTLTDEKIRVVKARDLKKLTVSSRTIFLIIKSRQARKKTPTPSPRRKPGSRSI
jgi:cobalt-precorrin-7 (C5)-methyltransferase